MALNFVNFINTNTSWTTAQKNTFLDHFVTHHGYTDTVEDGDGNQVPNPVTKTQYANRVISRYLLDSIRGGKAVNDADVARIAAILAVDSVYKSELE